MKIFIQIMMVVVTVLFWCCIRYEGKLRSKREAITKERLGDSSLYAKRKNRVEQMVLFLSRKGVHYRRHHKVSVDEYRKLQLVFALVGSLLAMCALRNRSVGWILAGTSIAFAFGYGLPKLYDLAEDYDENKKILTDLHNIYDTLRIYLAVDIFITDALEECYRRVANPRLKAAIYELKEGLRSQSEQLSVIEAFRLKFDNPHIDQLANLLSQYYRSGNVTAMMQDLSQQMVAIDHAVNMRRKERLEMKSLIQEVLMLFGMLGGIAIALLTSISGLLGELF